MKICLLTYRANPYSGGQGIYLKYVAEELVRQGHEVHAVVGPPYPFPMRGVHVHKIHNNEYKNRKGCSVINPASPFDILAPINFYEYLHTRVGAFPEISSFGYRAWWLLRTLHARHRFDIIHDNQSLGYGLLLMKTLNIPLVATVHHPLAIDLNNVLERTSGFFNKARSVMFYPLLMQRLVAPLLDHIITVSEDSKKRIKQSLAVPLTRQTVVYNGIDQAVFKQLSHVTKITGKILFVGNVEDGKKGFVYLLKAMPHIDSRVRLTIIDGGSPHRKLTGSMVEKLKLHDRLEFVGAATTQELVRHYNEAQIFVIPSVYEGFGLPAAEAMACGTPVISSDGGALPEVVGDAGIVIPARDHRALAHAVNLLIDDKTKQAELSEKGRARVSACFTWEKAVAGIVAVYEKAILEKKQ